MVKVRAVWMRMGRILSREDLEPQVYIFFLKYVVQSILIFGAETWVVTPLMGRILGGFQDQVVRQLAGRPPRRRTDGKWEYTSAAVERVEAGFKVTEEYIRRRQKTVAKYIDMR